MSAKSWELFTWSDAAQTDFDAVAEYRGGEKFRASLATTIAAGWDGIRDKPAWALASLTRELSHTDLGLQTGYDLLHRTPVDIIAALLRSGRPTIKKNTDGTAYVDGDGGKFRISQLRIRLLQAYLEFMVTCDDAFHGEAVLEEDLDPLLLGHSSDVGAAARRLSKRMYAFRQKHFDDGHANNKYSKVRGCVHQADNKISDETPFEMWARSEDRPYNTYAQCYFALRDYVATVRAATARAEAKRGIEWSETAVQDDLAVDGIDLMAVADVETDVEEICSEADAQAALDILGASAVKLFKKDDIKFMSPILKAGAFGKSLPIATARLMSFAPIQSAISTNLQTKKATVPLEQRVQCLEAVPYSMVLEDLRSMEQKTSSWMKAALATRTPQGEDPRLNEVRAEGLRVLAAQRSKTFQRDAEDMRARFSEVTPSLLTANQALAGLVTVMARRLGSTADAAFGEDRLRFAAVLSDIYLRAPVVAEGEA